MASAGRGSELQALVFDPKYVQFKPKGARCYSTQVNDPWYILAVPTDKSDFGAPNYMVTALRYYHRYMTEHPELRKGSRHLFIPIKDVNARKELSAATISRWICTTIVDCHADLQNSKCIPWTVKAYEVPAVQPLFPDGSAPL